MFLTRYSMPSLPGFRRSMDDLFDAFAEGFSGSVAQRPRGFPPINLWEDGQSYVAEAEVPGLTMDELEVTVAGNQLTLKGCRKSTDGKNLAFHRRERGVGEFTRVLTLPVELAADSVEAALKNGVLTVRMPKAESAKARRIRVETN